MNTAVKFAEKFGGYNDIPPNLVELSEAEYVRNNYFSYEPVFVEFRQFVFENLSGKKYYHNFRLYYMDEHSGYAVTADYDAGKVRYFRFGCNHEYAELTAQQSADLGIRHFGNCYHVYKCTKCDKIRQVDSSG